MVDSIGEGGAARLDTDNTGVAEAVKLFDKLMAQAFYGKRKAFLT